MVKVRAMVGDVGIGVEMLLQPGERELHRDSPPVIEGTSSGTKP